jgi:predicted phage tail protein
MKIKFKGKQLSLGAKILGAAIAVAALFTKATVSPELDIDAALKVAAFVVIIFAPVGLSMIFGNIFGTRTAAGGGK